MFEREIRDFLSSRQGPGALFVLKGFPPEPYGGERPVLADMTGNKLGYLMKLAAGGRNVIPFETFLCLYDLLLLQYQKIYILENPIYHTLYPIQAGIEEETVQALLAHFDPDAGEDAGIGDLSEYTNLYGNLLETGEGIACCYNFDGGQLIHEKIERYTPPCPRRPLTETVDPEGYAYVNLCTEAEYYELVQDLCRGGGPFAVSCDSYALGKEVILRYLRVLGALFGERVALYTARGVPEKAAVAPELMALMERYWGYSSFRNLKVYDVDAVQQGEKRVRELSQGQIVSDLVEQVEHCVRGESFRDVFVTAPTGAGKSLIFQLPAMYFAQRYDLVTLVITPLIGLMNDQVQMLGRRGYTGARTINSDISPILKEQILEEVASGACSILYLSPESLLSRSDVQQLIGPRRIGMLVVDEAHIVTTWGKQFRPDYWYLGDHVQKLRRAQLKRKEDPMPFVVATFTATAIYEGKEDMYHETLNSLHMIDPITYLGYIRRENISIEVSEVEVKRNKTEYEINKFDNLVDMIQLALMRGQKALIYFPTVALINRFYDYCFTKGLADYVAKYHGQMDAADKDEGFQAFRDGKKLIMAATKAFGMGIDIPDIAIVSHYAPTGNVCDYMQEIGRAARDTRIDGHAIYAHMSNDFQHINRLHGLSAIRRYQLIEVIKKVLEIYVKTRYREDGLPRTKRRNEMLVDAESFSYIFDSAGDSSDLISKVKTAMLLIQKDYENRGFAPFYIRPIPIFAYGYFAISKEDRADINRVYGPVTTLVEARQNICKVELDRVWEREYRQSMSFPKFKYLLYSGSPDLAFGQTWKLTRAMVIDIFLEDRGEEKYRRFLGAMKELTNESAYAGTYLSLEGMVERAAQGAGVSPYRAESMVNVMLAAMELYQKEYARRMNAAMFRVRPTRAGKTSYAFTNTVREFYRWLERGREEILSGIRDQKMYITNHRPNYCKEITTVLGVLESVGELRFQSLGGSNSQLYIYVNETKTMQMVRDRPDTYRNRLLDLIGDRHRESVRMMTFLFQNGFTSDEIWEHLENYFLGILPPALEEAQEA